MPPPLPRRRGPAAAGTDAGPKASNENRTPRLYVPYSEEFKRLVPFPLSPEAGQAAMFALALHGAGSRWDQVRFLQKPEPGLGPEDGLRGEASNWHVWVPEAGITARTLTLDNRDTHIGGQSYRQPPPPCQKRKGPIDLKEVASRCLKELRKVPKAQPIKRSLSRIQEIHADLDFYKVPAWSGAAPKMVQDAVFETLARRGIPRPGLVVFSGQGLQLVWLLETGIDPKAAPKAMAAMRKLVQILKAFGADSTDLAKLLRLPGTINSKSGVRARLLTYEPDHRQDFDELCLKILGQKPKVERLAPKQPEAPAPAPKAAPKAAVPRSPEAEANFRAATAHKRLADILRIVMGKWGGRVPEGYRNVVAHLVACELIQTGCSDPHGELIKWCARYTDDHSEDEILDTFKTARAKRYNYGARGLGEKLGITTDDVHRLGLTAIAAGGETDEQFKERRRKRDAELKRQRREAAGATAQSNSTERQKPWLAAGVSRATYYRHQTNTKSLKRIKNSVR
jgi:hypothetical protein